MLKCYSRLLKIVETFLAPAYVFYTAASFSFALVQSDSITSFMHCRAVRSRIAQFRIILWLCQGHWKPCFMIRHRSSRACSSVEQISTKEDIQNIRYSQSHERDAPNHGSASRLKFPLPPNRACQFHSVFFPSGNLAHRMLHRSSRASLRVPLRVEMKTGIYKAFDGIHKISWTRCIET